MKKRLLSLALALVMALGTLPLAARAESEPNDSASTADKMTLGGTGTGRISKRSDDDYFELEVPYEAGKIKFSFTAKCYTPSYMSNGEYSDYFYIEVYKGGQKCAGWRGNATGSIDVTRGTYYVRVMSYERYMNWVGVFSSHIPNTDYTVFTTFTCSHVNYTDKETKAATCSENGEIQRTCNDCEALVKTTPTDKLPHTPDGEWATVQEPTCSAVGKRTQTCTVCGGVALEEDIEKLPHEATWKTTQEATCAAPGRQNYICSVCGEVVETKSIPTLAHTFGSWTVTEEGNCRKDGKRVRECSVCGERETQTIDAEDNHDWSRWQVQTKATCTEDGKEYRQCGECYKEETRTVRATGHSFGKWQAGDTEGTEVRVCADCGEKETREAKTQPDKEDDKDDSKGSDKDGNQVSVTKANSTTPTVIVLVVPAFSDVSSSSWYQSVVTYAYNLGLMVGTSETSFNPLGNVTVAEAVTMAARARNSYEGGSNEDFAASGVWYQTYVDYAVKKGIIKNGDFDDYTRVATRGEMAYIFAHALPDSGMKAINSVKALPDVDSSTKYSKEIFKLYNAGIITGSDAKGTFLPDNPITRSEAAAIITRVTLSSERKTLELK